MLLDIPDGFGTQNNWDAMHDSIRYELGGQDSSHTGQAMEVSDDEDSVRSEIMLIQYSLDQYEQPAQGPDDQGSIRSETQRLSHNGDVNLTRVTGDSAGNNGKWRYRSESLERRSVGSEMSLIDDDARHSEHPNSDMDSDSDPDSASVGSEVVSQCFDLKNEMSSDLDEADEATRWQDEPWALSIRYRTAFPDSGLQLGASSNYNEDERGQYEQPAQEFDDQESVASETQTLSLDDDVNVTQDEGDSVGTEFREFGKWRYHPESLERRSVGSEMSLIDDDARHSEHPNSDTSMDSVPDSASVGSEVVPQCFDQTNPDLDYADDVMQEWEDEPRTVTVQYQGSFKFNPASGLARESLVDYESSSDEDEDMPSPEEIPTPSTPLPHCRPLLQSPPKRRRRSTPPLRSGVGPTTHRPVLHYPALLRQGGAILPHLPPVPPTPDWSTPTPQPAQKRSAPANPFLPPRPPTHPARQPVPPRQPAAARSNPVLPPRPPTHPARQPVPPRQPAAARANPLLERPVPAPRPPPTVPPRQPAAARSNPVLPPRPPTHPARQPAPPRQPAAARSNPLERSVPPPRSLPIVPPRQPAAARSNPLLERPVPPPRPPPTVPPRQPAAARSNPLLERPVPPPRPPPIDPPRQPADQARSTPLEPRPPPPTPAPQHPPPRHSTAHSTPQQSAAAPKSSRQTILINNIRARKRSNIGLRKRNLKSPKDAIASAVRELVGGLEELGAMPDRVQQFERHQLPKHGPRTGMLEYDTVGTMGSLWNKRLIDITLERSSTHPQLATADAQDVCSAVKTHLTYKRRQFKERALNRSPDPEFEEERRLEVNRYNRLHKRHDDRLFGLNYFAHEPSVKRNFDIMNQMDPAIHSEDESRGDGRLVARHPPWRSRQNVVTDFFRVPDTLNFATHFRSIGCKHRNPGQLPAIRTHLPETNPTITRIPVGLPENMYDEQWLRRYKEDEPLLYGTLKVQPPIDLRNIQFSGPVMRLVDQTRLSATGAQRMVGK
ncbi:hypothetical protein DFH07DRAFT_785176 [Mycena maculata]|uniref:Uncharacterized protein n=1 Tax=Mycena maculata TaxID=230809 RepID=A0AAD7MIA9_9AGAR|nr:hypothetical protein DFH07DRAFT_785176 [Mycena maculata]